jgi:hypothetical protein
MDARRSNIADELSESAYVQAAPPSEAKAFDVVRYEVGQRAIVARRAKEDPKPLSRQMIYEVHRDTFHAPAVQSVDQVHDADTFHTGTARVRSGAM